LIAVVVPLVAVVSAAFAVRFAYHHFMVDRAIVINCDYAATLSPCNPVKIPFDTPEIEALIASEEKIEGEGNYQENFPRRLAVMDQVRGQPHDAVPYGSYCRQIEASNAICSRVPSSNPNFVKVEVTTGTAKGAVGWICLGEDAAYTMAWP
jgi:hypothetical protein